VWSPGIIDGLVQTQDYARTLLSTAPEATAEIVSARLANRMARQRRVLYRDDPPDAWLVVDEMSLYRRVGSPAIMAEQMRHLSEVARLPHVTLQVLPAVAHPANASDLIVTDDAAYVEHLAAGYTYTEAETVTRLTRLFGTIRGECYRVSESAALFERMTEIWTHGARAAIQTPTAERA
jgi:hypothetical protein